MKWEDWGPQATHFHDNGDFMGLFRPVGGYQLVSEGEIRDFNPLRIARARLDETKKGWVKVGKEKGGLQYLRLPLKYKHKTWVGLDFESENVVKEYVTNTDRMDDDWQNLCSY